MYAYVYILYMKLNVIRDYTKLKINCNARFLTLLQNFELL